MTKEAAMLSQITSALQQSFTDYEQSMSIEFNERDPRTAFVVVDGLVYQVRVKVIGMATQMGTVPNYLKGA